MNQKMKKIAGIILVVIAIGVKLYQDWDAKRIPEGDGTITRMEEGQFLDKFTPVKMSGAGLELIENCKLIKGRNSDGDSFHVKHAKGENEFRLYFVDTPESEYKTYGGGENNGERLDEQGEYFGGLDRDGITAVGVEGKSFVLNLLSKKPFKVLTKWEDVVRPGREYCFVIVEWEGREVYLHELLVAQGLVRLHTRGADLPGGRGWKQQREYLEKWEKDVKKAGIGAWGYAPESGEKID
jgi:endonuclease YncB( thermonuclease family)